MKRLLVFAFAVIIAASGCGRFKKYGDVREFINEVVSAQNEFLSRIDRAISPDEVISAVDDFGKNLFRLSEKSMELRKKYPEIDKWVAEPPAELKDDLEKINDTEGKFDAAFQKEKMKILLRDKKVQDAFIELNRKMERVKFFQ